MLPRLSTSKVFLNSIPQIVIIGVSLFPSHPALAHNVKVAGDVAGLWHIEPNHHPQAGETAQVWIVLTRQGGKIVPWEQGNCRLAVYLEPRQAKALPVLQPTLKAVAVEKYQGIPGADVIFPQAGSYELELDCQPKTKGDFTAFQMKYTVAVAPGSAKQVSGTNNWGISGGASAIFEIGTGQPLLMAQTSSPPFLLANFKEIVDFRVFGDRIR
jgi:hypothetical protein